MIIIYIGTRAQLIKMAPIIKEIELRKFRFTLIFTGQHKETMAQLVQQFEIESKIDFIYKGEEITGIIQMSRWFIYCLRKCKKNPDKFVPKGKIGETIILVHGDTFSTLLGALLGKIFNIKVGHVEAGLRSFNIFHPFPEELTRLFTFRLSSIAFCPGEWACNNIKKYNLTRIDTVYNTLIDSVRLVLEKPMPQNSKKKREYAVCSIHRFENIFNKKRLAKIVYLINEISSHYSIFFVLHPSTKKKLLDYQLLKKLQSNSNVELLPRMGYVEFIQLVREAQFVITDGGSNQEELSYMQKPTLLMRKHTERQEGIDTTVTLCAYDEMVVRDFLSNLSQTDCEILLPAVSPSRLIVDNLIKYGN